MVNRMADKQLVTAARLTGNPSNCPLDTPNVLVPPVGPQLCRVPLWTKGVLMSGVLEGFSSVCQNQSQIPALLRPDRTSVKNSWPSRGLAAQDRIISASRHHSLKQSNVAIENRNPRFENRNSKARPFQSVASQACETELLCKGIACFGEARNLGFEILSNLGTDKV